MLTLLDRRDITLDAVQAVAWRNAPVAISPEALTRMDQCAGTFEQLVRQRVREDPAALIYGVTSAPGDSAATALDVEAQDRRPARLWTAMSYGEPLPMRVVRAIVLARLANFLGGHAAARGLVAEGLVEMLNVGPLPAVPAESNGGAGEILALGTLFHGLSGLLSLTAKERMALINGSPCAAAATADIALGGRPRLALADQVFALAADLVSAPLEHFAPELEDPWNDPDEAEALRTLRGLLANRDGERQHHQASVSIRILPRVLGQARRAQSAIERAAGSSLASVSDNPVYVPPTERFPLGNVYSTGGYHNAQAAPAIDALAFAQADLCQLTERLTDHLFQHPLVAQSIARDEWTLKPIHMAITGWAEHARASATPTLMSLGGFGQNDVPALHFLAWTKAAAVARCLDAALAGLAVVASQALYVRDAAAPDGLQPLIARVREHVAPISDPRPIGEELTELTRSMTEDAWT